MKAIVYNEYGSPDVLHINDVVKPTPKENEVLVRIEAASANAADWHLLRGAPYLFRFSIGLRKPKHPILGCDIAGVVEAVGSNVSRFRPGDEVYGDVSGSGWGGYAEYVSAPETALAPIPAGVTFEQAAAVPVAAVTALRALRDIGKLKAGEKVLINGASGGVGTFAVQIAKALGAHVTAVCSTRNVEMVRSLGADNVIDYTKEDFTKGDERYDLIVAANGFRSLSEYQRLLAPKGRYVMTGGSTAQMFQAMLLGPLFSMTSGKTMGNMLTKPSRDHLLFLNDLLETGKMTPVIDRRYELSQVPDAIRYVEEGHAKGKVVITVNH